MVAPNSRLLKAFPLVCCVMTRGGNIVPEPMVSAAADRGVLSQLEAWLDFYENQPPTQGKPDVPGNG